MPEGQGSRGRRALRSRDRLSSAAQRRGVPDRVGEWGDPGRPAKPGCGPLTRLLDVRRDRAGDARPQDEVQRPQAPQQPPTHGSPPPLVIDRAPSERSGRRLRGPRGLRLRAASSRGPAPGRPGRCAGQMWRRLGSEEGGRWRPARRGEAPGGRGEQRRRPAPAPVPGVCARGRVVGPGARVTHSTSPGSALRCAAGGNRKLLANSWAGPLPAPRPGSQLPIRPRDQPLRGLWPTCSCPSPPSGVLAPGMCSAVPERAHSAKEPTGGSVYAFHGTLSKHLPPGPPASSEGARGL